jgi:monothiol glutaredoxin
MSHAPESPRVEQLAAPDLKAKLDAREPLKLIDVRTEYERAIAAIEGSELLDNAVYERLLNTAKDTPLVFVCHHGIRSQAAADHFAGLGFRHVYNVIGGIDAWSLQVDPSTPRY